MKYTGHDYTIPDDPFNRQLPFFVYGTLRPDCGNDHCWIGEARALADGRCWVEGFRIVGLGIPFALRADGERTVGALIVPDEGHWPAVAKRLDSLESFRPHQQSGTYDRQEVAVTVDDDMPDLAAWMYVCDNRDGYFRNAESIPNNDFAEFGYYRMRGHR